MEVTFGGTGAGKQFKHHSTYKFPAPITSLLRRSNYEWVSGIAIHRDSKCSTGTAGWVGSGDRFLSATLLVQAL